MQDQSSRSGALWVDCWGQESCWQGLSVAYNLLHPVQAVFLPPPNFTLGCSQSKLPQDDSVWLLPGSPNGPLCQNLWPPFWKSGWESDDAEVLCLFSFYVKCCIIACSNKFEGERVSGESWDTLLSDGLSVLPVNHPLKPSLTALQLNWWIKFQGRKVQFDVSNAAGDWIYE
jgi:hypothetical protein